MNHQWEHFPQGLTFYFNLFQLFLSWNSLAPGNTIRAWNETWLCEKNVVQQRLSTCRYCTLLWWVSVPVSLICPLSGELYLTFAGGLATGSNKSFCNKPNQARESEHPWILGQFKIWTQICIWILQLVPSSIMGWIKTPHLVLEGFQTQTQILPFEPISTIFPSVTLIFRVPLISVCQSQGTKWARRQRKEARVWLFSFSSISWEGRKLPFPSSFVVSY